eukprot:1693309-Prymnesium_polylepis.1
MSGTDCFAKANHYSPHVSRASWCTMAGACLIAPRDEPSRRRRGTRSLGGPAGWPGAFGN